MQADEKRQLVDQFVQPPQQLFTSDKLSDYLSIMGSDIKVRGDKRAEHIIMLETNDICFNQNAFSNQFSISVKQTSTNCEVVVFECRWGDFSMPISVLNVASDKPESRTRHYTGGFGDIQQVESRQGAFVMKTLYFNQQYQDLVRYASLREWFLLRICSTLRIGPYLRKYIGFDLIFYRNCVDFAMEECTNLPIDPSQAKSLYSDLSLMHGFYIVHTDIKPENIMFSPTYQKCVFIDFGLSKIIGEKIGYKTRTRFSGSLSYASQEMIALFHSTVEGPVDLYFNDGYCLQQSLVSMHPTVKVEQQEVYIFQEQISVYMESFSYFAEIQVKYLLFTSKIDKLDKDWRIFFQLLYQSQKINEILNFSQEIKPNRRLHRFLGQHLPQLYDWALKNRQIKGVNLYSEVDEDNSKKKLFLKYFTNFCQISEYDFFIHKNVGKVRDVIFDQNYRSHTPDVAYLRLYLVYMSYVNNFCRTSNSQRFEAAKMFYRNFLKRQHEFDDQRSLIQATIIRSLQWINDNDHINLEHSSQIQDILIMLPQFLMILDFASQVFFHWLQSIYHHKCLSLELHLILIQTIRDFQFMLSIRKRKSEIQSRKSMIDRIQEFFIQKRDLIQNTKATPAMEMVIRYLFRDNDNSSKQIVAFIQSKKMQREVQNGHLRQIIKITFFLRQNAKRFGQTWIEVCKQIRELRPPQRVGKLDTIYFLCYKILINRNVSERQLQRWKDTLKSNINCKYIEETFLLDKEAQLYKRLNLLHSASPNINSAQQIINKMLEYFGCIHIDDFGFHIELLFQFLKKFLMLLGDNSVGDQLIVHKRNPKFQKVIYFLKIAQMMLSRRYFQQCNNDHLYKQSSLKSLANIQCSLAYLESRQINQQKIQEYIDFLHQIECKECRKYKEIFEKQQKLRHNLIELAKQKDKNMAQFLQQSFISDYVQLQNRYRDEIDAKKYFYSIFLLFYFLNPANQEKYHLLRDMYFDLKNIQNFDFYISLPPDISRTIQYTLMALHKSDQKQVINFLGQLALLYRQVQTFNLYYRIVINLMYFLRELPTCDVQHIYSQLTKVKNNPYISLYYHIFLKQKKLNSITVQKEVRFRVIQNMHMFHSNVQTYMKIGIYFAQLQKYSFDQRLLKRKNRFNNNIFLKLLVRCYDESFKVSKLRVRSDCKDSRLLRLVSKANKLNFSYKLDGQIFRYIFTFHIQAHQKWHQRIQK